MQLLNTELANVQILNLPFIQKSSKVGDLLMASNFKITLNRLEESIHLKLYGDFDGSSAHELLNLLKNDSYDTLKIYIHTDGLKHIYPFGLNTFFKSFRIINGCADRIVFTGKKAPALAFPSDH